MNGPDELRKLADNDEPWEAEILRAAADAWEEQLRFAMAGWNGAERVLDATRTRLEAAEKETMAYHEAVALKLLEPDARRVFDAVEAALAGEEK
jgi:hypothetical protein